MKVQIYSDIHIESRGAYNIPKLDSDIIILAGDIDAGLNGLEWAEELRRLHKKPVIYVAGNHEYYGYDYNELTQEFRDYASQFDNVHFLEKDELIMGDVRFLGATLWTDYYEHLGYEQFIENMSLLNNALRDHVRIRFNGDEFTANRAFELNKETKHWLDNKLDEPFTGKTVVITHHGPSNKCNHREFGANLYSPGFVSDLDYMVEKADNWFYGHTHSNEDFMIGKCRVVSNQVGYRNQTCAGNTFNAGLLVEI